VEVDHGLAHAGLEGGFVRKGRLQCLVEFIGTFGWVEFKRGTWVDWLARSSDASNGVSVLRHGGIVGEGAEGETMGNDCGRRVNF
jgi:hypothetical protein